MKATFYSECGFFYDALNASGYKYAKKPQTAPLIQVWLWSNVESKS